MKMKGENEMKKLLALLLAMAMVLSLAACGGSGDTEGTTAAATTEATTAATDGGDEASYTGIDWDALSGMDYDEICDYLYEYNLGEFYEAYQVARAETENLDLRYALMAVAEAKLMESATFIPTYGDGGSYAITRVVPRSASTVLWGLDEYKFETTLICNELITSADRATLIEMWSAAADEATWLEEAKAFLEENGYTLTDTWNMSNGYEIETWDIIATSYTSDSYFLSCLYTPLLQYDTKNVQQPAAALSYEVNEDGTVYTFHLREGMMWVDQQGREIAEVTANDWVTSMMHVADNNDALGYLMSSDGGCGILNYDAYINGEVDFSEVGVKALDDYTLEYTLEAAFPAFVTMMGYGCFAPINYDYYKSQGGTFGAEGDEYTPGTYGTSPETIAYCGAYLVTNFTANNITSYAYNPSFWNVDAVNTKYINMYYYDGTDVLATYNDTLSGKIASCSLNSSSLVLAKEDTPEGEDSTYFDLYSYTTTNSATVYCGWVNLYRGTWSNFNDTTVGVSSQDEEMQTRAAAALSNQNFRLALTMAFDKGAFNATIVGEDLKYARLWNSYTPGNFVVLTSDVTIDINGTATTFPAGTYYGEIMQAQIDADGIPATVWDPTADDGAGSSSGFDGWYNPDAAVAYLEAAIEELAQIGIEISAENPLHIDVPYGSYSESSTNRMQAYKQSIENVLGGLVIIDLIGYEDQTSFAYAYYRISSGSEANYDVTIGTSGWGPDYGDPQSYLDTLQPYGYMTKCIGLY